jgi:superoxide dismutase
MVAKLVDDYGALEPSISGKIMELHHKNHHQTYVNSFNAATEQLQAAVAQQDIATQVALQPLINFHGGGHINHSLFWENLAPSKNGGGGEPTGQLKVRRHHLLPIYSFILPRRFLSRSLLTGSPDRD